MLVAGLIAAGVIHIQKNNDQTLDITVDKQRLQQTEQEAFQVGGAVLQQAEAQLQNANQNANQNGQQPYQQR
jgi:hypothetical protein